MRTRWRRFWSRRDGSAVTEFALVVPMFFLVVYAVMAFGRAYQRLNVLTGALREGARFGSTLGTSPCSAGNRTLIRGRVRSYGTAFGVTIDTAQVAVTSPCTADVRVGVSNYALFADLTLFGLDTRTVTRTAIFRYELAP